jgi:broad specificity phosphatase PhoE
VSRLLLIRHGQTTSNVRQALDTALPGAALTDLGWSQAYAAGETLAGQQEDSAAPLSLVSSQALRARQTAAGIAAGGRGRGLRLEDTGPGTSFARSLGELASLEVTDGFTGDEDSSSMMDPGTMGPGTIDPETVGPTEYLTAGVPAALGGSRGGAQDSVGTEPAAPEPVSTALPLVMPGAVPGISEIPAGRYEMRVDEDAHYDYHRTFAEWLGGAMEVPVPGAFTGREVVSRYLDTLLPMVAAVQRAGSDLAVVSHGAVIRLIAAYLGRVDPEFAMRTLMPNTSRVDLEIPDAFDAVEQAADGGASEGTTPGDTAHAVSEGWKITDWAGRGEPPRAR